MEEGQLTRIRDWFTLYVKTFKAPGYGDLENILLKEKHSVRVAEEMRGIGEDLGLKHQDLFLAEAIGLLHDVGRFEQFVRYGTFVDAASVNHAVLGEEIIRTRDVLAGLDSPEKEIILAAVINHSRLHMPDNLDDRTLFFCRLLRDADKLDILKVMLDYYSRDEVYEDDAVGLHLPEGRTVSPLVLEDLREMRTVQAEHVRNRLDFKLLQISWVYDINFPPSMKRLMQRCHIGKLRELLPDDKDVNDVIRMAEEKARIFSES